MTQGRSTAGGFGGGGKNSIAIAFAVATMPEKSSNISEAVATIRCTDALTD